MRKTAAFWLFAVRPSSWEAASSYPGYWLCPADCWARLTCLAFELLPVPASQGFVLRSCLISRTDLSPSTSSLFCGPCTTDSSDHHSILLSSPKAHTCWLILIIYIFGMSTSPWFSKSELYKRVNSQVSVPPHPYYFFPFAPLSIPSCPSH